MPLTTAPTPVTPEPPGVAANGAWGAWTMGTGWSTATISATTVLQATGSAVWDTWYTTTTTTTYTAPQAPQRSTVSDEARTDWERRCRERDEAEAAARERAEVLLRMVLSPEELTHYEDTGRIVVTGSEGNLYEIGEGIVGNVYQLDDAGEAVAALCCHPTGQIPHRDSHAAQVLALRNDEELFRATANIEWGRVHRGRPQRRGQMAA